jgi:hypothetical protein
MAIVLPGKFIFLATPYTASMAVARALKDLPGAFAAYDKRHGVGHHARLDQIKKTAGAKLTGTEQVIVAVRNPYDVLVSWYLRNLGHSMVVRMVRGTKEDRNATLREFVELWLDLDMPPYVTDGRMFYHADDGGLAVPKRIVRYENLENTLNAALRACKAPHVKVGRENATPGKDHWSTYYDAETYAFVNDRFRDEFVKFGYPFLRGDGAA